jgi:hypothetical protein
MTQNNSNDLYAIDARVKNLARDWDAHLTPMGTILCNHFTFVLKDLYDFSDTLSEPYKHRLKEILEKHEGMPRKIIELGRKKK